MDLEAGAKQKSPTRTLHDLVTHQTGDIPAITSESKVTLQKKKKVKMKRVGICQ